MAAVLAFMEDPLVAWVRTFSAGDPVDFEELSDGVYLHDVLLQIDQRGVSGTINRSAKDTNARIQNWQTLLSRLKSFYQDVLRHVIVMDMPNVVGIVKYTTKESSLTDLKTVLLLLLGCAVQCDQKEEYVKKITKLDIKTQEAIVVHIKEVTEDNSRILSLDHPDYDKIHRSLSLITKTVSQQRDRCSDTLVTLTMERDYYQAEIEKKGPLTPPDHLEKYHLLKELNMAKNVLKASTQDIDDKSRLISDLREEVTEYKTTVSKLRTQNFDLQRTSRAVQSYRDEVDSLKECALKAERLEKDITRYKEKINELDFYRSRVEEVRDDNAALSEAKTKLEDQLFTSNKRIESIMDELVSYQIQCEESQSEKDKLQRKLQEVMDENAALEFEHCNMKENLPGMKRMMSNISLTSSQLSLLNGPHHKSISDELKDSVTSHVTKLEQENEELKQHLEENKQKMAMAQREFDKAKSKLEHEYERKVADTEQQTRELRNNKTKELTKEYETKIASLEKQQAEARRRMSLDYKQRMSGLEQECGNLREQLTQLQERWIKDKQQREVLEKKNRDINEEKENFKKTLKSLEQSSGERIKLLESSRMNSVEVATQSEDTELTLDDLRGDDDDSTFIANTSYDQRPILMPRTSSQKSLGSSETSQVSSTGTQMDNDDVFVNSPSVSSIGSNTSYIKPVVTMRSKTPTRGIVTPQRRLDPNQNYSYSQPHEIYKHREDNNYSQSQLNNTSTPLRPRSEVQPFSRNNPLRQSMPERLPERIVYVSPKKQVPIKQTPPLSRSRTFRSSEYLKSGLNKEKSRSRESFTEKLGRFISFNKSSPKADTGFDRDSGHATSPDSPNMDDSSRDHRHRPLSIYSSESIRNSSQCSTSTTTTTTTRVNEKMRGFVEKIVDLQDKNQDLILENSELKRAMSTYEYVTDRLDKLEERNILLEVENRKLKKIIESLQGSGRNPHDNRIYHYYSNV